MATPAPISDALRAASARGLLPTAMDSAGIRTLDAALRARSVFIAHGTSTIYLDTIKKLIDRAAAGELSEGQVRTAMWETLKAIGYTPEGGFPGDLGEVPPALAGTLQDLSSFRRRDLIVRTQLGLMRGAGLQMRGHTPERREAFPAWELVRLQEKTVPRDWHARWVLAGGTLLNGRMIAAKGDPVWGELGASDNFPDALDVDHPPFAFESGMGWNEKTLGEWKAAGMTDQEAADLDAVMRNPKQPRVIRGQLPLPAPRLSLKDVDPALVQEFKVTTKAKDVPGKSGLVDFSDLLEEADEERRVELKTLKKGSSKKGGWR